MNRTALAAVAAVAAVIVTAGGIAANPPAPKWAVAQGADGGCVIPDCRNAIGWGSFDEHHAPMDCMFGGPYSQGGAPVWRGCSMGRAEYAVGSACVPISCDGVTAGEDPFRESP